MPGQSPPRPTPRQNQILWSSSHQFTYRAKMIAALSATRALTVQSVERASLTCLLDRTASRLPRTTPMPVRAIDRMINFEIVVATEANSISVSIAIFHGSDFAQRESVSTPMITWETARAL